MKIEEVKQNMNKAVKYKGSANYTLCACILRKSQDGFYYQAELLDANRNSVVFCKLEDVGVLE